ncbi:MAG TPA: hypothetical protein VFA44_07280 [Gaiellaceae bacterium]|nr:hypothetical protein [Gaiellaceae bacterium]
MWVSVRRYASNPELASRLAEHADDVKGLISQVPGFVSYYLIHDGRDTVSITVARDRDGVDRSNQVAAEWLREHAAELPVSAPQITEGEVLVTTSG